MSEQYQFYSSDVVLKTDLVCFSCLSFAEIVSGFKIFSAIDIK